MKSNRIRLVGIGLGDFRSATVVYNREGEKASKIYFNLGWLPNLSKI